MKYNIGEVYLFDESYDCDGNLCRTFIKVIECSNEIYTIRRCNRKGKHLTKEKAYWKVSSLDSRNLLPERKLIHRDIENQKEKIEEAKEVLSKMEKKLEDLEYIIIRCPKCKGSGKAYNHDYHNDEGQCPVCSNE